MSDQKKSTIPSASTLASEEGSKKAAAPGEAMDAPVRSKVEYSPDYTTIRSLFAFEPKEVINKDLIFKGRVQRAKQIFIHMSDGSTPQLLQLVLTKAQIKSLAAPLHVGTTIIVVGKVVVPEKHKEQQRYEVQVKSIEVVGPVRDPITFLPSLKDVSLETWRKHAHLRFHDLRLAAIFRIRSKLSHTTHEFMDSKGLLHLDPNIITNADCEGAGEMFVVTTDAICDKISAPSSAPNAAESADKKEAMIRKGVDWSKDHFRNAEPARLTVSSQLGLEFMVPAMGAVYTTNKSFRAEESDTTRHLAEFSHVEAELPWVSFQQLMDFEEEYVCYCFSAVLEESGQDLQVLEDSGMATGVVEKLKAFLKKPFGRVSYNEAISILEKNEKDVLQKFSEIKKIPKWGDDLGGPCERYLAEIHYKQPIFVYGMPKILKSFYMKVESSETPGRETVQGCDLLIPGMGELIGGSIREFRYDVLVGEMLRRGMYRVKPVEKPKEKKLLIHESPTKEIQKMVQDMLDKKTEPDAIIEQFRLDLGPLKHYADLRKNAATPTGGFGLGFERLITVCTSGWEGGNIRDRVPFPVAYKHLEY